MASTYGGSHVCLAATHAEDASQGFYLTPDFFLPYVRARVSTSESSCIRSFCSREWAEQTMSDVPLGDRAWTLQESYFSRRIIYFGNQGVQWQCNGFLMSQYSPSPIETSGNPLFKMLKWDWAYITGIFSSAELTYGSDRLPALSGIASSVYKKTADKYLAGMWRNKLEMQLAWSRRREKRKRPEWRAPTWSWISIDGIVGYNSHDYSHHPSDKHYFRVMDAWTQLKTEDPFGAVLGGELTLRCCSIIRGQLYFPKADESVIEDNSEPSYMITASSTKPIRFVMDCQEAESLKDGDELYFLVFRTGYIGISVSELPPELWDVEFENEVERDKHMVDRDFVEAKGIVLRALKDKGHFTRIGSFCYNNDDENELIEYDTDFMAIWEGQLVEAAEDVCISEVSTEELPDAKYVIKIY